MRSRVVPGMGVTMAFSFKRSAFRRLDLPTLVLARNEYLKTLFYTSTFVVGVNQLLDIGFDLFEGEKNLIGIEYRCPLPGSLSKLPYRQGHSSVFPETFVSSLRDLPEGT